MSVCWIALCSEYPARSLAAAQIADAAGEAHGWLAAWEGPEPPVTGALRIDPRAIDPAGPPAWISLVLPAAGARPAFDDLAVQQARRAVLAERPPDVVSTLLADDSRFAGAITVRRAPEHVLLADDPFARIARPRVLAVGEGLLAARVPLTGPTIERHGSAQPWPWDRFAA